VRGKLVKKYIIFIIGTLFFCWAAIWTVKAQYVRLDHEGHLQIPSRYFSCNEDTDCVAVHTVCNSGWLVINKKHQKELENFLAGISYDCQGFDAAKPDVGCRGSTCSIKPIKNCMLFDKKGTCIMKCNNLTEKGYCACDTVASDGNCPK